MTKSIENGASLGFESQLWRADDERDISVCGQESNYTTWRLANMKLAIRGIDSNLGPEHADRFHHDLHPDLRADYVLANAQFNDSDWRGDLIEF